MPKIKTNKDRAIAIVGHMIDQTSPIWSGDNEIAIKFTEQVLNDCEKRGMLKAAVIAQEHIIRCIKCGDCSYDLDDVIIVAAKKVGTDA